MELRFAKGRTWQWIANELGYCSKGAACQDVQRGIDALNAREREAAASRARGRRLLEPVLRRRWANLMAALADVDPVELVLDAPNPRKVMRTLGHLSVHVADWLEQHTDDDLMDNGPERRRTRPRNDPDSTHTTSTNADPGSDRQL
jgi:hypothetical protein